MIEGPDPQYFTESEQIPPELMELMGWGIDEEDEIRTWLRLPCEQRAELLSKLRIFLNLPPTSLQLFVLLCERPYESNETELLSFIEDICRRLELSLRGVP